MRVVISAGPTREAIDPVRFISNRSTGRMGYALAAAAVARGMETVLVSGPVALPPPDGLFRLVRVETAAEMAEAMKREAGEVAPAGEEKSAEEGNSAQPPAAEDEEKNNGTGAGVGADRRYSAFSRQTETRGPASYRVCRRNRFS